MRNTYIDIKKGTPVNGVLASRTTAIAGDNNDLVFTSKLAGSYGNNIIIEYQHNGNDKPAAVWVEKTYLGHGYTTFKIIHQLATNASGVVSTVASNVMTNINGHAEAKNLVVVTLAAGNSGAGLVAALAPVALIGGVAGTKAVGNEIYMDDANLYICVNSKGNSAAQANWKKVALANL